jgi:hypothetical protein
LQQIVETAWQWQLFSRNRDAEELGAELEREAARR